MKRDAQESKNPIEVRVVNQPRQDGWLEENQHHARDDDRAQEKPKEPHCMKPALLNVPATLNPEDPVTGASAAEIALENALPVVPMMFAVVAFLLTSVATIASMMIPPVTVTIEEKSWSDIGEPLTFESHWLTKNLSPQQERLPRRYP
jgi:hypothetical protein